MEKYGSLLWEGNHLVKTVMPDKGREKRTDILDWVVQIGLKNN